MSRALAAIALVVLAACSGVQRIPDPPAELRVVAVPPTAIVYVNERFAGTARVLDKKPVRMKPGKKRVTVQAPGYFPHDFEVDLPSGVTKVDIKLRAIPP
jgi:hypothetical protein